tara:strand:+ start:21318 stop:22334 length:1017 start_codon:yes stop_codon:yes gene_type:complete
LKTQCAYPTLAGHAEFKKNSADFKVDEMLSIEFTGEGEHLWLHIEKSNTNTDWLAGKLAHHFDVQRRSVSYSGLKDRHATTRQWFSIQMPGRKDAINQIQDFSLEDINILEHHWHQKKLHMGTHSANIFTIWLRNNTIDKHALIKRLDIIKKYGVPNYFGPQRFGFDGQNIKDAAAILANRKKSQRKQAELTVSALRSYMFNQILSERVKNKTWTTILPGEALQMDGQKGYFLFENAKEEPDVLREKCIRGACHPTGGLWGDQNDIVNKEVAKIEDMCFELHPEYVKLLANRRLDPARRSLRMIPHNLVYEFNENNDCCLSFALSPGCFATSVLKEII